METLEVMRNICKVNNKATRMLLNELRNYCVVIIFYNMALSKPAFST